MEALIHDLRYAVRSLSRARGFSTIVIGILALGIGACTAIFSFVNGVLLSSLPFPEPSRLIAISELNQEKRKLSVVSPRNLEDWEKQSKTIEQFGAWRDWRFKINTPEGANLVSAGIASPGLFTVLGVKPVVGRLLLPQDNQPGRDRVVVISYSYWLSNFGGDATVIGQTITLDNELFTLVGVLPRSIESLPFGWIKVWAPVSIDRDQFLERHVRNRRVYARLSPGASIKDAQTEMDSIAQQLAAQYPKDNTGFGVAISSLQEAQVVDIRRTLLVLLGAVSLVLLVACANVANLLFARSASRRKEFAVRAALGAGRMSLVRQLLTEALVLAFVAGAIGILLAFWMVDLFVALSPSYIPHLDKVKLDGTVAVFALSISFLTGVLFGIWPALTCSRVSLVEHLKAGQKTSAAGIGSRLRGALMIGQVALALVLLIGSALLTQTFFRLVTLQPGFNPRNLLSIQLFLPDDRYKNGSQVAAFYQRVTDELRNIPGVTSIGATSAGPQFGGIEPVDFLVEGQTAGPSGEYPRARYYNVGPDYFHTMQIPLLSGREFNERDTSEAPQVAIINQTMARRFFAGEEPVGRQLLLVRSRQTVEIVGVVGDVKRFELENVVEPEVYWPYMQRPRWATYFVMRTESDPLALVTAIRSRISGLDKDIPVVNVSTIDELVAGALKAPRFNAALIGACAAITLMLAAFGLYALISYAVTQRTHEIGVRIAIGAGRKDILRLIVGQGMLLTIFGVAIGLAGAFALTRAMSSLLFGVSATDAVTFMMVSLLLSVVSLLACYVPALRATRVDPMVALRQE